MTNEAVGQAIHDAAGRNPELLCLDSPYGMLNPLMDLQCHGLLRVHCLSSPAVVEDKEPKEIYWTS
ncbi:hypothetical protein CC85DRAFT_285066 [Cutaneotrichosporon oleaginosum]|uniref:Uncharacterized protein n=1 Tax=Cutaneotrichosporon oleaginosum TaxID=879819 RepID=A0A0J1B5G0_9TREE|nr:uncharacterized protein CC85DRAFT_285066 [Cutaneotrichosporon oleaginosum]KLT42914.1 hypothetical protein CC85DRAFT_285066 [Cutaneotrichosporon oleaginosum]TXT12617.1 hypothetical protein COLE_03027 [Cutaneotrichosporon oleaginosum]